jgi:hypothetical protein
MPSKYKYVELITNSGLSPAIKGDLLNWARRRKRKEVLEVIDYLKAGKSWKDSIEIIENRLKLQKKIIV